MEDASESKTSHARSVGGTGVTPAEGRRAAAGSTPAATQLRRPSGQEGCLHGHSSTARKCRVERRGGGTPPTSTVVGSRPQVPGGVEDRAVLGGGERDVLRQRQRADRTA